MHRLIKAFGGARSWRRLGHPRPALARDHGASLVEYGLAVGLMAAVSIAGLEVLGSRVDETHADQIESIEGAELVATSDAEGADGGAPTVSASCSGATCGFSVASAVPGTTYAWTVTPDGGAGTGTAFTFTGAKNGGPYTVAVTATPGGTTTKSVTCTKGSSPVCTAG